jgi:hypothetical protein
MYFFDHLLPNTSKSYTIQQLVQYGRTHNTPIFLLTTLLVSLFIKYVKELNEVFLKQILRRGSFCQ